MKGATILRMARLRHSAQRTWPGGFLEPMVSIDNPCGTPDRLERLAFGSFRNAVVDIESTQGLTGNQTYTPGLNQASETFYVRRLAPGPVTVPLHVMD